MLEEIYQDTKEHMDKSLEALKRDYTSVRTGKVTTKILDGIKVNYYGTPTELSQVATVLAIDATTISINPCPLITPSKISATILDSAGSISSLVRSLLPSLTLILR